MPRDGIARAGLKRAVRRETMAVPRHVMTAMPIVRMTDLDLAGKRVLIRQDLNVPVADGKVTSGQRITGDDSCAATGLRGRSKKVISQSRLTYAAVTATVTRPTTRTSQPVHA